MRNHAVLVAWLVLVLSVTLPWTSFRSHAHWDRVGWIPFRSGAVRLPDLAENLILYVPLGWWWARHAPTRPSRALANATVTAALLSLACEWAQVYSHGRFPSSTDVFMNTVGAVLGVLLFDRQRRRGPPERREL
jgi:glycopeptide antibiotics resistance protein